MLRTSSNLVRNLIKANLRKNVNIRLYSAASSEIGTESNNQQQQSQEQEQFKLPSRPNNLKDEKLTGVIESKEDFEKYVKKILPNNMVPDPPVHKSYPTPSGWVPPDSEKASRLPYFVLRTRFHQFPIYPEMRDGSKRYVLVRNIEGNIWVG